jgi:hypothetical protein
MSVLLQLARNTNTNLASYTPAAGEIVISTTDWHPRVGDGTTAGGRPVALSFDLPSSFSWPANQFYASPNGSSGAPTFRALVSADLPSSPAFTGNAKYSALGGISAAGATQGTATALTKDINEVTTVAAGTGVILFASAAGNRVHIANAGANALAVYPASGEAINALAANTAFSLPAGKNAIFFCAATGKWYVVLTA